MDFSFYKRIMGYKGHEFHGYVHEEDPGQGILGVLSKPWFYFH